MLHRNPSYFEVFPNSKDEAYATMIYPTKSITNMKALASDFKYITQQSIYSKYFQKGGEISRLWGVVPVGRVKRKALNRIFFFGESALSNPAATGTCLTRLLLNYKKTAGFLLEAISAGDLSEKALSSSPEILSPFISKLQMCAFKDILTWNSDKYSKYIRIINHANHELINKFLFGDLLIKDLLTKEHMRSLLKPKNIFLAKPLLKTFLNSI